MNRHGKVVFAPRDGMGAGKGDFPRNVGEAFRKNFDSINWSDEVIPEVPSQPSQE